MSKPEDSPYICWIDLETTGKEDWDFIIEFGGIITDRDFNVLSEIDIVGAIYGEGTINAMDEIPRAMHTSNGLLDEALKSGVSRTEMDLQATNWIRQYTKGNHIPLAGSGVSHFDRKFIDRELIKFKKYISYWAYDVGTLRRSLQLFGLRVPNAEQEVFKTHRALEDIRVHVAEMRAYKDWLTRAALTMI